MSSCDWQFHPSYNYLTGYSVLHKTMDYEQEIKGKKEQTVDTLKIHYFEEFIRLAQLKGVSLVSCVSPSYKTPADYNEYGSIKLLCKQYQVPFFYYGSDPDISCEKRYFQDMTHMNDEGAKLYTGKLMSWIKIIFTESIDSKKMIGYFFHHSLYPFSAFFFMLLPFIVKYGH